MPPSAVSEFPEDPTKAGATGVIGHYTQIVWAETSEVGCGYIRFTDVEGTVTDVSNEKQILNYFATCLTNQKIIHLTLISFSLIILQECCYCNLIHRLGHISF